jgi:Phytanoyl-CoA dioxygenase (PhyH)
MDTTTAEGITPDRRTLDDATIAAHAERVRAVGWSVVEHAISLDFADAIAEDLPRLEHDLGIVPGDNAFEGRRTTRIYNLLVHGSLSSIAIGSDEQAQPIHSDDQLIPLPKPHPPLICNTIWAITDFTEENGATRLCPGTHLADHSPDPFEHYDSIPAEMPKGGVLIWVGSLWHGGGANTTSERRVGIAMNYCAGYVRQQENQQLGIPIETMRRFPRRLQELCGYSIYNGLIGHIDKQHPGKRLLGSEQDASLVWDYASTET